MNERQNSYNKGLLTGVSEAVLDVFQEDDNNSETQRKELLRLLGTAVDEERKKVIEKAIVGLDNREKSIIDHRNARLSFNKDRNVHSEKRDEKVVPLKVLRPTSAQIRRISMTLDAIPEHKVFSIPKVKPIGNEKIFEINQEHIYEVFSSSYDPKFPPANVFHAQNHTSPSTRSWIATGLVPQFLTVHFETQWRLHSVGISVLNITQMSITAVCDDDGRDTQILVPLSRLDNNFAYVYDETPKKLPYSNNASVPVPIITRQLIFNIESVTEAIFGFLSLSIRVANS